MSMLGAPKFGLWCSSPPITRRKGSCPLEVETLIASSNFTLCHHMLLASRMYAIFRWISDDPACSAPLAAKDARPPRKWSKVKLNWGQRFPVHGLLVSSPWLSLWWMDTWGMCSFLVHQGLSLLVHVSGLSNHSSSNNNIYYVIFEFITMYKCVGKIILTKAMFHLPLPSPSTIIKQKHRRMHRSRMNIFKVSDSCWLYRDETKILHECCQTMATSLLSVMLKLYFLCFVLFQKQWSIITDKISQNQNLNSPLKAPFWRREILLVMALLDIAKCYYLW